MFTVNKPTHFLECNTCPILLSRIEEERKKSLDKHGVLDDHKITITCEGTFSDFKVMWAAHQGIRYPKGDESGFRVDGVMISGGDMVDCPGLR